MTLFEGMLVAHFVSDWIFQSQWEANNKSTNVWAMLHHCSVYTLFFVPVLAYFHQLRISILLLLFISHFIFDNRRFELWILKLKGIYLSKTSVPGEKVKYAIPLRPYYYSILHGFQEMDLGLWWIIMIGVDQTLHLFILGLIAFLVS